MKDELKSKAMLTPLVPLVAVRANMVNDPGEYRWSSYRHNGLGQADPRLTPHPLYLSLETKPDERQAAYRALFRSQLDDDAMVDIRQALSQGQPLGDTQFSAAICTAAGVRRTQAKRGRPAQEKDAVGDDRTQANFGF